MRSFVERGFRLTVPLYDCAAVNVLAIDQGTSSTKALVVSPDGGVLAEAEAPVHPHATADGGVEQDPEELWQSVLDAGRRAHAHAPARRSPPLGLANQGETVLAWERASGRPLSPAISWQDRRALAVCERLRAQRRSAARRAPACRSTPTSPRPRCAGCASK